MDILGNSEIKLETEEILISSITEQTSGDSLVMTVLEFDCDLQLELIIESKLD